MTADVEGPRGPQGDPAEVRAFEVGYQGEQTRQATHDPAGAGGPGVPLMPAGSRELGSLGMSPGTEVPADDLKTGLCKGAQ